MIKADQPFSMPGLRAYVSSHIDGTMLDRTSGYTLTPETTANRKKFCQNIGIDYRQCVYQIIDYGSSMSYDVIARVDAPSPEGTHADVLYTETPHLGLMLPVADCIAIVVYDPVRAALALAHIGRHASIAGTIQKTIQFFIERGSRPKDLQVWMSPSIKQPHYKMKYFDHIDDPSWSQYCQQVGSEVLLDLPGYNLSQIVAAGVPQKNVTISPIDTADSSHYFSHHMGDEAGRFVVVAWLT